MFVRFPSSDLLIHDYILTIMTAFFFFSFSFCVILYVNETAGWMMMRCSHVNSYTPSLFLSFLIRILAGIQVRYLLSQIAPRALYLSVFLTLLLCFAIFRSFLYIFRSSLLFFCVSSSSSFFRIFRDMSLSIKLSKKLLVLFFCLRHTLFTLINERLHENFIQSFIFFLRKNANRVAKRICIQYQFGRHKIEQIYSLKSTNQQLYLFWYRIIWYNRCIENNSSSLSNTCCYSTYCCYCYLMYYNYIYSIQSGYLRKVLSFF